MVLFYFLVLFFFLILLVKSARIVIAGVKEIDLITKIPYFFIGFFIIGVFTSIPEFSIGVISSFKGVSVLSFGNLVGGAFLLLSFVTGLGAIFYKGLNFERSFNLKELILVGLIILIPSIFALDGEISRLEGILIIIFYFFYALNFKNHSFNHQSRKKVKKDFFKNFFILLKGMVLLIFGVILLLLSSSIIVGVAQKIVNLFNIAPIAFGLIILSLGTNLPEISIVLNKEGKNHIASGTILGSAAANSLIVGIIGLINPVKVLDFQEFLMSFYFLLIGVVSFIFFAKTKSTISPFEGILLVILYIAFLMSQIFLTTTKII